jgi:hypothetical protein
MRQHYIALLQTPIAHVLSAHYFIARRGAAIGLQGASGAWEQGWRGGLLYR